MDRDVSMERGDPRESGRTAFYEAMTSMSGSIRSV